MLSLGIKVKSTSLLKGFFSFNFISIRGMQLILKSFFQKKNHENMSIQVEAK